MLILSISSVKGEVSGKVSIPHDVRIECKMVTNTFAYNERDEPSEEERSWSKMKILVTGSHWIPAPVLTLQVKIGKNLKERVDAVIVMKHKNVLEILTEEEHAVKHVIMIMISTSKSKGASLMQSIQTSGEPDSATKEFLHQLSTSPRLKSVPFLYFSDHDTHKMNIFKTLKYGSKKSSWVTDISICPQLT